MIVGVRLFSRLFETHEASSIERAPERMQWSSRLFSWLFQSESAPAQEAPATKPREIVHFTPYIPPDASPESDSCPVCMLEPEESSAPWLSHQAGRVQHALHEHCLKELLSVRLKDLSSWKKGRIVFEPKPEQPACPLCQDKIDVFSLLPASLIQDALRDSYTSELDLENPWFLDRVVTHLEKEVHNLKEAERLCIVHQKEDLSETFGQTTKESTLYTRSLFLKEHAFSTLRAVISFAEAFFAFFVFWTKWGSKHLEDSFQAGVNNLRRSCISLIGCFSPERGKELLESHVDFLTQGVSLKCFHQ